MQHKKARLRFLVISHNKENFTKKTLKQIRLISHFPSQICRISESQKRWPPSPNAAWIMVNKGFY
jgi:phosphoglycolate phosphatase-like HAD superfamily hydrolase